MSWPFHKIGELATVKTGKLDANASSPDGQYPFFTCAREPLAIDSYSYDCECVLVAGNGDLNVKHFKGKFDAYQRTYIIEPIVDATAHLSTRFLYYFLETYLDRLRELSIGGIIKYIKKGHLTEAEIPLPPLAEQKRIAKILDAADALRAKRRESLAQLDTLLQSTFLEMFGDPVENPKGWPSVPLGETATLQRGFDLPVQDRRDGDVPIFAANGSVGTHVVSKVKGPGVVTGRSGTIGKVHFIKDDFWPLNTALWVKDFHGNQPEWASHLLRLLDLKRFTRGVGVPTLNRNLVHVVEVPVPPQDLQRHFSIVYAAVEQQKTRLLKELAELDTLFAALQQRAFTGEL